MARYVREISINAAPEQVFAYEADMTKHAEWAQHDLEVSQTSAGGVGVGSTFSSVAHQFGTQRETQSVIDYTPGHRFAFDAQGALGTARHSFDIEAAGTGARVSKSMEIVKPSLMARIMAPMIGKQTKKALEGDLEKIKQQLEG